MNILIINGSPKGEYSTTLHTCLYLQKRFEAHSFDVLDAGKKIKSLQKDFSPAIEAFKKRLNDSGITTTLRASRGEDVMAACGLLAGKGLKKN